MEKSSIIDLCKQMMENGRRYNIKDHNAMKMNYVMGHPEVFNFKLVHHISGTFVDTANGTVQFVYWTLVYKDKYGMEVDCDE